jgi:hyperosmotically inducible periplasmic protein
MIRQINPKFLLMAFLLVSLQFSACKSKPKDSDLQASVNEKLAASGVSATVTDGVVTLNGQCPDESCRTSAEQSAKNVKGVKSVVNNISVTPAAPVEISPDAALESGVRDATKDYPGVTATVANGEVTVTGTIERDRLAKLMQSLHALNPKKINNNLTIK